MKEISEEVIDIPKILLLILPQYFPIIPNKIRHIDQPILLRCRILMSLHNGPRYNTDITLLCQRPILVEVQFPLIAELAEARFIGHPVCEMVFREYSELSATGGSVGYEFGGACVVGGGLHGLHGE